jgi:glycosyltransferase involved in cell wall biosynthesis
MTTHRVIYSIATKFGNPGLGTVSYNAVKALYDGGLLKIAVSYGNKSDLPKSHLLTLPGNPFKLLFFLRRRLYKPLRKGFLDYVTSKIILQKKCDIFHGWNNQALRSIKAAKRIGAKTILECGSTHRFFREKILNEEHERLGIENIKSPEYARQSSLDEITLSDFIFLPSEFAKKTFIDVGIDNAKLFVIKRGVNLERFKPSERKTRKFKVLFVGRLSLRKGVQYLLEAWREMNIKDAELVFVGSIDDNIKPVLSKYNHIENIVFKGFIKDPSDMYKESTIFVFPSIEEGSAKVTYEAMAAGLPVITTENSGSVVRNGLDGFIIPIRDSTAIREKISYFYENPEMIEIMSANALENIKNYTWQRYRDTLIQTYNKLLLCY